MSVFFSNRCEILAEELFKNLYENHSSPFERRLVIVSNKGMKFWLERWLAKKAIFFGVDIIPLDSALKRLLFHHIPSHIELSLAIKEKLYEECVPMSNTLLPEKIAYLFRRYALYGYECFARWEENPSQWQERVWRLLFGKGAPFIPLARLMRSESLQEEKVHLFGLSHLPTPIFHFFRKSFFYQFSYCQEFWSDILSDKESIALGEETWSEEWSPLLRNFALVIRKALPLFEEGDFIESSRYLIPEESTQLKRGQARTLFFEKSLKISSDDSIQIHVATSRAREVEILHNRLVQMLSIDKYTLSDVLVLAPDIQPYIPYLTAFLPFPLTILDYERMDHNSLFAGLSLFFALEARRFSSVAIFELFSHHGFRKKQCFSDEDLEEIKRWMELAHIRWGFDLSHKNRLMKHNLHPLLEEKNSFKEGLERLLEAITQENDLVKISKLDLLYQFYDLSHKIYYDLTYLYSQERTFEEYVIALEKIAAFYFVQEEKEPSFIGIMQQLKEQAGKYQNTTLSFTQMQSLLKSVLPSTHHTLNQNGLNYLLCASLSMGSQLPYKVIYIMGLEESSFPRKEFSSHLDLLRKEKIREYVPSKVDFDRGFFLEAFFSAQDRFIMSYVETPSLIIEEIKDYFEDITTYHHPQHGFDSSYFTNEDPNFKSFLIGDYHLANALQTQHVMKTYSEQKTNRGTEMLDLKDLVLFVKSPLKHVLKHKAEIYFPKEHLLKEEEEFTLSSLESALMLRKKEDMESQITALKEIGAFPQGNFGHIATRVMKKKTEMQQKLLACQGIDSSQLFTVTFEEEPIKVGRYILTGVIENVFTNGLLVYDKGDFAGAVRTYPIFLAATLRLPIEKVVFGKDGLCKKRFFKDAESLLIKLLDLYSWAKGQEAFLFPELIEPLLMKDQLLLTKRLEQIRENSYDEALHFFYRYQPFPTASFLMETLHEKVRECYQELKDGWF